MNLTPQQQRIIDILSDGAEHAMWELLEKAHCSKISSRCNELERMGFNIPAPRDEWINGKRRTYYRLIKEPKQLKII